MRLTFLLRLLLLLPVLVVPLRSQAADSPRLRYAATVADDAKGAGLSRPEGVACTADRLVVADTANGRLILYSLDQGAPKGGTSVKIPQLLYPVRVQLTSKGDILALDGRQRKIVQLTGEGAFRQFVEPSGVPEGTVIPEAIDLDQSDNLFVLDTAGNRVLLLDSTGKYQRQIPLPAGSGFFTAMAVDRKAGTVYIVDAVNAVAYSTAKDPAVFSAITKSMKDDLQFAGTAAVDAGGAVTIADEHGGGIVVIGADGTFRSRQLSYGYQEGYLRYPGQLCIDPAGDLLVADRENSRIEEFSPMK